MTCAKTISVTFSGIAFDGAAYGFGDVNRAYSLNLSNRWSVGGACLWQFQGDKVGKTGAYVEVRLNLDVDGNHRLQYIMANQDGTPFTDIFQGSGLTTTLTNQLNFGGVATIA